MLFSPEVLQLLLKGIGETFYMVFVSSALSYIIGIPLGVILYVTDKNGIHPMPALNSILGVIINFLRSIPFIILLIMVLPVTRFIVGTTLGATAVIPPLVFAAAPYIARMVESSLRETDAGVVEAAQSMGATNMQIITKVLLPEAVPSLITGATISVTTIVGYSAMAGFVGGGGLGAIAINYGYYRYETAMMIVTVVLLVLIVQLIQYVGNTANRICDKRIR